MEISINLLADISRKVTKPLLRDFYELENLQSGTQTARSLLSLNSVHHKFANTSMIKVANRTKQEFEKYYDNIFFTEDEMHAFIQSADEDQLFLFVQPIEGINNFVRSLPQFAFVVFECRKKSGNVKPVVQKIIMNFPAMGEIYYAQKSKGVSAEKYSSNFSGTIRMRCSSIDSLERACIASDAENAPIALGITRNIRIFNSESYALALLVSGKIDAIFTAKSTSSILHHCALLIDEASGMHNIEQSRSSSILIATNRFLYPNISKTLA